MIFALFTIFKMATSWLFKSALGTNKNEFLDNMQISLANASEMMIQSEELEIVCQFL